MRTSGQGKFSFARDGLGLVWAGAAAAVALIHRQVPASTWLMLHLVLLGALTHAILVWSAHFARALLKTRPDPGEARRTNLRLWTYAVGALGVFAGVPAAVWPLTVAGATLVAAAVAWHGLWLVGQLRRSLPGRFRGTLRYYLAAAACLPVGAAFGATLAYGLPAAWHARLLVAHSLTNLLGFVGLTVTGTLVTFWPTILRTKMDDRAERLARLALPVLGASLVIAVTAALLGWRWGIVAGVAGYLAGLGIWGTALVGPLRTRPPKAFAPASVGAALGWFVVATVWTAATIALRPDPAMLSRAYPLIGGIFAAGFAAQILLGAWSYLLPSTIGGGPSAVRAGNAWADRGGAFRLVATNAGLVVMLAPVPSWVKVTTSVLILGCLLAGIVFVGQAARATLAARRAKQAGEAPGETAAPRPFWRPLSVGAALLALALAAGIGIAVDPRAAGLAGVPNPGGGSGHTTRVTVVAKDMRFVPAVIDVPAGDRLIVELHNEDGSQPHDLLLGDVKSSRVAPGGTTTFDAGVQTVSQTGWCTVVGHRQMGMELTVRVGATETATTAPAPSAQAPSGSASNHQHGSVPPGPQLARTVDPALPPLTDDKVRKVTLRATEEPLEVAPGVWQKRWTFGGGSVGPTLHGRVGDVFEVTLVNDGTIGHSIDFHAGALAPDQPMRTIQPGESLVYRFTAGRAGIWMYHCSTMPMSAHIAAGMTGAVVIEPDGLAPVRSYVLVQSEVYLGAGGSSPDTATEVDAGKIDAEQPDKVVFNGIANQYDQRPFDARVGERVRFWVLDAGPNRPSSFHIVGGQFDTVYLEGAYRLKDGKGAMGETGGGAQALGLQPAQGGFVELTFPEAGHYPVVSHVMIDAERGAHGIVRVA